MLPKLLSPKDIKDYLHCNNNTLYALLRQRTFPSFRIGKRYYIEEAKFLKWIEEKEKERK